MRIDTYTMEMKSMGFGITIFYNFLPTLHVEKNKKDNVLIARKIRY
jgi:hypothetical protein